MDDARGNLRVGDTERDQAMHDLRQHGLAGRLTSEEVGTRIFQAQQARTVSDLDALFFDLPWGGSRRPPTVPAPVPLTGGSPARPGSDAPGSDGPGWVRPATGAAQPPSRGARLGDKATSLAGILAMPLAIFFWVTGPWYLGFLMLSLPAIVAVITSSERR